MKGRLSVEVGVRGLDQALRLISRAFQDEVRRDLRRHESAMSRGQRTRAKRIKARRRAQRVAISRAALEERQERMSRSRS